MKLPGRGGQKAGQTIMSDFFEGYPGKKGIREAGEKLLAQ